MNDAISTARRLLQQHTKALLMRRNVVATGVGYKMVHGKRTTTLGIICSVEKKLPVNALSAGDRVPPQLDGIPADVIETGCIRAWQAPTGRFRPASGGVSVGHKDITAGTLGCWVRRSGEWVILSNNHVLANSNEAAIGDAILQPGSHDGGIDPADQIAVLKDFVPIELAGLPDNSSGCSVAGAIAAFLNAIAGTLGSDTRLRAVSARAIGKNRVDAAIASPLREEDVTAEIMNIGAIQGVISGDLGMAIKKMGRTTGFTEGEIQQVDVTVNVQYGGGRSALFKDQLMAGAMSQGGDSGSAVLDTQNQLLGLLFAGSEQSTIINRIEHVFSALDLTL
ncbi:MAG TPA: hypothetical protein ENI94_13105 [Gammaproteobacteria bacterium]|nr:hypothetical protein [Gammaproteobacteria bacterium]